jgi:anaerobic magnesium-protoporphyrin IX monomethyl ester cyclase
MLLKARDPADLARPEITEASRSLRVLVVFPSEKRGMRAMYSYQGQIGHKPPLGPMAIATYLRQHSVHEVRVVDLQAQNIDDDGFRAILREYQPHVVGISAWTNFWYEAWQCIQVTKEVSADIHVTVGGPHIGIYADETLTHSGCDSVVAGDGEVPFFWLCNGLANGAVPHDLPGLHTREHGVKTGEGMFYIHGDLTTLPFPDRRLLPVEAYTSPVSKSDYITTMITSRGCPYKCTFCKLSFQKPLFRSAESVLDELEDIVALGIKEIEIYDDTFTWSRKRLIAICKGIVARGLDIRWSIRDRVSSPTEETMEWLAKAGCQRIQFGIEAGTNKTLEAIKKEITVEQAFEAVRLAKKYGIEVLTYFMLGMPGEEPEDMEETIRFVKRLDPDYATFSVTVPYAGTEIYQQGLERGIIPHDHWRDFAITPTPHYVVPHFWEEHVDKEGLMRIRDRAVRGFFFRPSYMLRQLRRSSSPGEIRRKWHMAWGLFKVTVLRKEWRDYTAAEATPGGP